MGLQTAIVTRISEDPGTECRVEVEFPDASGKEKRVWARLSYFGTGGSCGAFFIPEKGDEVVLGFLNEDPECPVVLGTLCGSAPGKRKDENPIRSVTTQSKMKLEFDDEKRSIALETPGGNVLRISDRDKGIVLTDQNNNKIVMDNGGITIESAKAITLKARTDIKMEAGFNWEAKAQHNSKLQGLRVEAKASNSLHMTGAASAELSASGTTRVKGSVVMIN